MALTDDDIQRIIDAEKGVFTTKTEFLTFTEEMKSSFADLQSAVDAYAKKADTYFQEMAALSHKVDRLENQIKTIARTVGIDLKDL